MASSKWATGVALLLAWAASLSLGARPQTKPEPAAEPAAGKATPVADTITPAADKTGPAAKIPFDQNAFPPTMPDRQWHRDGWIRRDCMRCHETGVGDAPRVRHNGLPPILLKAKCRSCHVLIPGQEPRGAKRKLQPPGEQFNQDAFPPMIPASGSHRDTWRRDDCLLCHEDGLKNAPIVRHQGLPRLLLRVKCRSCHVQIRSHEADIDEP